LSRPPLTPLEKSLKLLYGEQDEITFNISTKNPFLCKASCRYEFADRSKDEVLDSGVFNMSKGQHFSKNYNFVVKKLGTGQDLYNFQVVCRNIESFFCPSESQEIFRSSLVIVNYEPTELQKKLKGDLKENVTKLLVELSGVDELLQEFNQKMFDTGPIVNLDQLSSEKIDINDKFDQIVISVENLRGVWTSKDYESLSELFNESFFDEISLLKIKINDIEKSFNETLEKHNSIIQLSVDFVNNYNNFNYLSNTSILFDKSISAEIDETISEFNIIISALDTQTFQNYDDLKNKTEQILSEQQKQVDTVINLSLPVFLEGGHLFKTEKDLFCLLTNCTQAISIELVFSKIEKSYVDKTLIDSENINNTCNNLKNLISDYKQIRNDSTKEIQEKNITFPDSDEFKSYIEDRKTNFTIVRDNQYFDFLNETKKENNANTFIVDTYMSLIPDKKNYSFTSNQEFEALNLTLRHLSALESSEDVNSYINNTCNKLGKSSFPELHNFTLEPVPTEFTFEIVSKIDIKLSDNPPICCVFGECNTCCNDDSCKFDPDTFPIMFLHGHSVLRGSSVEYSLDAYNKIQHRLQDDGYINAGILSLYTISGELKEGDWGLSGKPVTVKASYYFDAFNKDDKYIIVPTKSESINTYALRIKDLVDTMKKRTGKPKINIIANSMGGLVARRYLQIFGDDSVNKLIMTGTPNKGIIGKVKDFCTLLGDNLECRDMQENSLFLNILNDPDKQPANVKIYTIAGSGCDTSGKDGDGIVPKDHVTLPNATSFVVNGKCTRTSVLHNDLLDTDKYPEVYEIIRDILRE